MHFVVEERGFYPKQLQASIYKQFCAIRPYDLRVWVDGLDKDKGVWVLAGVGKMTIDILGLNLGGWV